MTRISSAWNRLLAMMIKELWAVLRDPKGRIILIVPPIIQIVLFASAATLEVKNAKIGVVNHDSGRASIEFMQQIAGSPNFGRIIMLSSEYEMHDAIIKQKVAGVIVFPATFSGDIAARRTASVLVAMDGRGSNAAQIIVGYLSTIAANVGATLQPEMRIGGNSVVRHMFNPNLNFLSFMLPVMVVMVAGMSGMGVTSQSISRERELGSFDQLMVSPLRTHEILIGKMTPPLLIGIFNCLVYLLVITQIFGLPLTGSFAMYVFSVFIFLIASIGIGMVISIFAQTQQQAFLGMFLVTVPISLLSGFAAPVDNMPWLFQILAEADPQYHANILMEGVFLKAMPPYEVFVKSIPLMIIAAVSLITATLMFRSRVE